MKCPKCGYESETKTNSRKQKDENISIIKPMASRDFKGLVIIQAVLVIFLIGAAIATPFISTSMGTVGRVLCIIFYIALLVGVDFILYKTDLKSVNPFSKGV
jgi:hypothetical protein